MHRKKDSKKEQKKLRKEQERKFQDEIQSKIDSAYQLKDQLAPFNTWRKYERNGLDVTIESFTLDNLPKEIFNWAFQLVKKNMREMYERAWGWSDKNKKNEMRDPGALYLVAFQNISSSSETHRETNSTINTISTNTNPNSNTTTSSNTNTTNPTNTNTNTSTNTTNTNVNINTSTNGTANIMTNNNQESGSRVLQRRPVGFVYYRYDYEPEKKSEVLYVYEIQLEPEFTGKGLGKHLMQILELMAWKHKMRWILLTVFKENKRALNFYLKHMKYQIDPMSPSAENPFNEDEFEILSKCMIRPATK